jgi:ATP-dependent DNA helicase PIF1
MTDQTKPLPPPGRRPANLQAPDPAPVVAPVNADRARVLDTLLAQNTLAGAPPAAPAPPSPTEIAANVAKLFADCKHLYVDDGICTNCGEAIAPAPLVLPAGAPSLTTLEVLDELDAEDAARRAEPLYSAILGTAGTGKTYQAREAARLRSDVILCATTGIAAINIGGRTLNSLLWYYDTDQLRINYEIGKLNGALRNIADSGFRRLFIDEISMMDGKQLDILCLALDGINESRAKRDEEPLGLTLIGDFAQLPPVKAPFVFEQPTWKRFEDHLTVLTEPRRQADPAFVRALQAIRRGDRLAAMAYFAPRIQSAEIRNFDGSTILAKNDEVERFNKLRLLDLKTAEHHFPAKKHAQQDGAWKNIPDVLTLKPGALVMILANKRDKETGEMLYANGSLAHYEDKVSLAVTTEDGEDTGERMVGAVVTLVDTGARVTVPYILREKTEVTGSKGVKAERETVLGSIEYLPLRVAYATTVHKSQGLSLDKVQLNVHSQFWTQPGMLYVALSRARTPEGLHIVAPGGAKQFEARITVNEKIRRWL